MPKLKKKSARQDKRARNKARREQGLTAGRGARRTALTPVQLALMGKGRVQGMKPVQGRSG